MVYTVLDQPCPNGRHTWASLFIGIALAAALFATPTAAVAFVGKVVGVTDGDTLTVLTAQRQQHRVRLSSMDAPERRQAFGQVSKQHLLDLAYDKTVSVVFHKRDRSSASWARCSWMGRMRASIRSNRAWPGITRSTSASNPLRTGWPTLAPRRRLGQSGAVSGTVATRCRHGLSAGTERCAAGSPSRPRGSAESREPSAPRSGRSAPATTSLRRRRSRSSGNPATGPTRWSRCARGLVPHWSKEPKTPIAPSTPAQRPWQKSRHSGGHSA
jgi:hypothetical protein